MDDEAMFRMDSYLVQIFRDRKNQAGSETAHSQLVLFKLHVLSLLEIYLRKNPGNFFFLSCNFPLRTLIELLSFCSVYPQTNLSDHFYTRV